MPHLCSSRRTNVNFRSITTDLGQLEKLKAAEVAGYAAWKHHHPGWRKHHHPGWRKHHHPGWHYTPRWLNSALVQKLKASLDDLVRKDALPPLSTLPAPVYNTRTIPRGSSVMVTVQSRFVQSTADRRQRTAVTKIEHEMMRRYIDIITDALNAMLWEQSLQSTKTARVLHLLLTLVSMKEQENESRRTLQQQNSSTVQHSVRWTMSKEAEELRDEFTVLRLREKVLASDIARLLQQLSTARMYRRAARVTAQRRSESRNMTTIGFKTSVFRPSPARSATEGSQASVWKHTLEEHLNTERVNLENAKRFQKHITEELDVKSWEQGLSYSQQ